MEMLMIDHPSSRLKSIPEAVRFPVESLSEYVLSLPSFLKTEARSRLVWSHSDIRISK